MAEADLLLQRDFKVACWMTFEFGKFLCCTPQLKPTILVIKGAALVIIIDSFALKSLGIHLTWGCRLVFTLKSLSLKYQDGK